MAIAYDASTNSAGYNLTYAHTPTGTPRGVVVQIVQNGAGDEVTGVTYGGTAMTRVASASIDHTTGTEDGYVYTYFLGASVPTGAQNVVISESASTEKYSVCHTLTAAADTEVDTGNTLDSGGVANPSVSLSTTASRTTAIFGALHSGHQTTGDVAAGADYSEVYEDDFGSQVCSFIRRTSNGSGGSITVDWTAASEEAGIGAVAVGEIGGSTLTTTASDSAAYTDEFAKQIDWSKAWDETYPVSDSPFQRLASAFRIIEDTIPVEDVYTWAATYASLVISETIGLSELFGGAQQCLRSLSDSIAASELDVGRLLTAWRSISDSILLSETPALATTLNRQYSESVATSDTVDRVVDVLRAIADSYGVGEAFDRQADAAREISDSLPVSDVFARQGNWQRAIEDTVAISEAYRQIVSSLRGISDSLGLSETTGLALMSRRVITDTLGLSDSVSRETVFRRALSEFVVLAEEIARNADANIAISDTLGQSETVGRLVTNLRDFTDSLGLSDVLASLTQTKRAVSDSVALSDDAIRSVQFERAISESIPLQEEFARITETLRAITDSIGLSDTLAVLLREAAAYIWDAVLETRVWTGSLDMVSAPEVFEKQPSESDTYAFDFTDKLTSGESLSSGATVVATPAGLTISGVTISGARVECAISGGRDGVRYALEASAVTSLSQTIQCDGVLVVRRGVR